VLGVSRSTYYRSLQEDEPSQQERVPSPRKLNEQERQKVRDELNSERFCDKAPRTVYAELLDDEVYLCHWRTMYRILEENQEVKERRRGHVKRNYKKPELLATGPNQVWSWDITKLKGPVPWTYFYLYVIIDIFSRYVVGWMVADRESGELAEVLIAQTCSKQKIQPGELVLHSYRGAPIKAKNVGQLLVDLGVGKSHSRPYVSDDNPYSESQFKTLKYHPTFPERFDSEESSLSFCRMFLSWYNEEHKHSSLGLLSPIDVHYGRAKEKLQQRQRILTAAYESHPERFVNGMPKVPELPKEVWINPPKGKMQEESSTHSAEACE